MSLIPWAAPSWVTPTLATPVTTPLDLGFLTTRDSLFDQNFGLGVLDDYLNPTFMSPYRPTGYIRPWRATTARESGLSNVSDNDDEFKVNLDVQQFRPQEVTVKIIDNFVIVNGKHEERRDDHGYVCRSFQRRYLLPNNVDQDTIKSTLSKDGVLTITAPKLVPQSMQTSERKIPIVQTHVPAIATSKPTVIATSKPTAIATTEAETKAMDE